MRRIGGALADAALSAAAVLGAVGIALVVAGAVWGVRPLLFRSGSMSPTIGTGDLAVARSVSATDLHAGDIVSVLDAEGHRVTHRIVSVEGHGPDRTLRLRGDANRAPDQAPYVVARADRVVLVVHGAGWVVASATGPVGMFVLGLYVAALLVLALRRRPSGEAGGPSPRRHAVSGRRKAGRPVAVALGVAAASVVPVGSADAAAWTDPVPISGQPLLAATVAPTTLTCGALGVLSVTFNWSAVAGATSYTLHYGTGSTTSTTSTSATVVSVISGGTAWVDVNRAFGSTTWTSVSSNTRTYTVAAVSLCS